MSNWIAGIAGIIGGISFAFAYPMQAQSVNDFMTPIFAKAQQVIIALLTSALK